MTYIVCEPCIGTKDRACVEVCPVECFYEGTDQLYIHPEECIDCAACEPVCPVTAIFPEDSVPEQWNSYTPKNYKFIEEYVDAPHALTKAMLGDQENLAHTLTVEGKPVTFPPPPSGFGGPAAPPPPKVEAAPAPPAAVPAPPKVAAAPARTVTVAPDALSQMVEAAAAAAEAAARAAEAAAAAIRLLQGKADGRTVSGAPSALVVHPQAAPSAKPTEAKAQPKAEAAASAPAQRQAAVDVDPSFERAKEVLYALIDFESGARTVDHEELAQAEETATKLLDEIAKVVGKRDYTLQDLEKKDVVFRQKMELANAIVDHVARIRLQTQIQRQRAQTRAQIPGALVAFTIAGACAALGVLYVFTYTFPTGGTPGIQDLLTAPFTSEGFMPFLGFNLLAGLFALLGVLALFKLGYSWVEVVHLEALRPKEFGAASLRPRRWSWIHRLKIESQRILDAERMLQTLAAKKR